MKKKGVKTKMKKKLLLFIGVLTLTLSVLLAVPSTKAQTNTRLVVQSYNVNAGTITFYDYDTQELFGTFNFLNIYAKVGVVPFVAFKEHIPYFFRMGDVYELIDQPESDIIIVDFVRPADRQTFFTLFDMVGGQVYEYKGIVDNMYVFQQGLNFYKVPTTIDVLFRNEIEGQYGFETILKAGNKYSFVTDFGDIRFYFVGSPDYDYARGYLDAQAVGEEERYESYRQGYEDGMRLAEGLLESEYQRGFQNGSASGFQDGLNKGYQNGFDDAYNEIISDDEYTLGYNNGFKDGEKSKIVKNNEAFYGGIEKWLVPAIIVVIVLGGIFSIASFKRREA